MKTLRRSLYGRKGQRDAYLRQREKLARWRKAKEEKRLATVEPVREEWRGRLTTTITFHDRITGTMHTLDLYRGQRRDSYRVTVDGKPWRELSATKLAGVIRHKLCIHVQP